MKIYFIIFLTSITFTTGAQLRTTILTLEYQHGLEIHEIEINNLGLKFPIKQLCTTEIDSIISEGNVGFLHSKVGTIKDCLYQYQVRHDTLKTILIKTNKNKFTKQTIEQANFQFGKPVISEDKEAVNYQWSTLSGGTRIKAVLNTTKGSKTSELIISCE